MAPSVVIAALLATQLAGKTLALDPSSSTVRFHVSHKLHEVDGKAGQVEGKAVVGQDGKVLAMVRIPVASLDSGDGNRDANMRDVLEAGRYPFVVFKGISKVPTSLPPGAPVDLTLEGELDLHGMKRRLDLPARVEANADGSVRLRGSTSFSLEAFRIERPSLLLVKLEDDCRIDVDVVVRESK